MVKKRRYRRKRTNRLSQFSEKLGPTGRSKQGPTDKILLFLIIGLLLFGLAMVFDTSVVFSYAYFGDKYKFITQQIMWVGVGTVLMIATIMIPYKYYKVLTIPLLVITIVLLILVIVFSEKVSGAQRWLDLGNIIIQPSELSKLTYILYLSVWLSKEKKIVSWRDYLDHELIPFLVATAVVSGLVVAGRDLGTAAVIILISFVMYFLQAETPMQKRGLLITLGVGLTSVIGFIMMEPYRISRVQVFVEMLKGNILNPQQEGFQIHQVLIAIGSGGLFGKGFTGSLQKYDLVETTASTDSIFAILGEELGFFACITLVAAFSYLAYRGFKIAQKAPDKLGFLLSSGISAWIIIQAFINIGANVGLIPMTGMPLPFISYGGSSIVTLMIGSGILLNVSRSVSMK